MEGVQSVRVDLKAGDANVVGDATDHDFHEIESLNRFLRIGWVRRRFIDAKTENTHGFVKDAPLSNT